MCSARVSPVQFVQVFVPVQSVTTLNEWLCVYAVYKLNNNAFCTKMRLFFVLFRVI